MNHWLPKQIRLIERDWLSSNNILFLEGDKAALIDSGYRPGNSGTWRIFRGIRRTLDCALQRVTAFEVDYMAGFTQTTHTVVALSDSQRSRWYSWPRGIAGQAGFNGVS